jgi:hypothetical protein
VATNTDPATASRAGLLHGALRNKVGAEPRNAILSDRYEQAIG